MPADTGAAKVKKFTSGLREIAVDKLELMVKFAVTDAAYTGAEANMAQTQTTSRVFRFLIIVLSALVVKNSRRLDFYQRIGPCSRRYALGDSARTGSAGGDRFVVEMIGDCIGCEQAIGFQSKPGRS